VEPHVARAQPSSRRAALAAGPPPFHSAHAKTQRAAPTRAEEDEAEDDGDLRQRLTEREDERCRARPWSAQVGGHPLTVSGEYTRGGTCGATCSGAGAQPTAPLAQELEVEIFYSFGRELSLFAQARAAMEEDLLPDSVDEVSDVFVERGELWLYSKDVAGTHLNVDAGRLHFEDDRRWWWDEDLDAVRLGYERGRFELTFAVAEELAPTRLTTRMSSPSTRTSCAGSARRRGTGARATPSSSSCSTRTTTRSRAPGAGRRASARTTPTAGSPGPARGDG
jgi:hypothetical protein